MLLIWQSLRHKISPICGIMQVSVTIILNEGFSIDWVLEISLCSFIVVCDHVECLQKYVVFYKGCSGMTVFIKDARWYIRKKWLRLLSLLLTALLALALALRVGVGVGVVAIFIAAIVVSDPPSMGWWTILVVVRIDYQTKNGRVARISITHIKPVIDQYVYVCYVIV